MQTEEVADETLYVLSKSYGLHNNTFLCVIEMEHSSIIYQLAPIIDAIPLVAISLTFVENVSYRIVSINVDG